MLQLGPKQEEWLYSLETHPERQLRSKLGARVSAITYLACLLGELGLITGVCEWDHANMLSDDGDRAVLSSSFRELGLFDAFGGSKNPNTLSLAALNDSGLRWPEMAKIIRENPDSYFDKSY